jgi:hypothetical protein
MSILAWKDPGLLMEVIAKWLWRYRSTFDSLVAKSKNLPSFSKKNAGGAQQMENTLRTILNR